MIRIIQSPVEWTVETFHDGTGTPSEPWTEILKRARERGYHIHEWCYHETSAQPHGWLSPAEVEEKRGVITKAMWETEYEAAAPTFLTNVDLGRMDCGRVAALCPACGVP
jgi:hypothetical protein